MPKQYKRKEYIEKNSRDVEKLDKTTKKSFNTSNRQDAKREIKVELEDNIDNYAQICQINSSAAGLEIRFSPWYPKLQKSEIFNENLVSRSQNLVSRTAI